MTHGEPIYGDFPSDNEHGDTYGPVTYLAYVPFEALLPWSGKWDDLPAAHGAALVFDLAVVVLLFLLGRRIRGPSMGIVLAYAWLAFPFSLFVANTNANDALPAALVLGALLAWASPWGRGILIALAGLTKFAPLALVPLFARAKGPGRFAIAFLATAIVVSIPIFLHGGTLRDFWDAHAGLPARSQVAVLHLRALGAPRLAARSSPRPGPSRSASRSRCCRAAGISSASPPSPPPCSSPSSSR